MGGREGASRKRGKALQVHSSIPWAVACGWPTFYFRKCCVVNLPLSKMTQWFILGPQIKILSINIQGDSSFKEKLLASVCCEQKATSFVGRKLSEETGQHWPNVPGMCPAAERPHNKNGSALFVKLGIIVKNKQTYNIRDYSLLNGVYWRGQDRNHDRCNWLCVEEHHFTNHLIYYSAWRSLLI